MMPFRQDPSDPEQAGPSLTSAAVYSSNGPWSNRNPGWRANHHILKSLTASTLPKSTLNVRNLGFPPAPCALPASAIGRPIGKLTQERSSAAPACPLRLAACREWSTWASAAWKGALVTSKLSYGQWQTMCLLEQSWTANEHFFGMSRFFGTILNTIVSTFISKYLFIVLFRSLF